MHVSSSKKILLVNNLFPPYVYGGTEAAVQRTIDVALGAGHRVVLVTTQPDRPRTGRWEKEQRGNLTVYRIRPKNVYYYTAGGGKSVPMKLLWHAIDMAGFFDARVIREILAAEKPDLVHGNNLKGITYAWPRVCESLGIPYVHTLHNYQLLHPFGTFTLPERPPDFRPKIFARLYRGVNRLLFRSTSAVISPSKLPLQIHQQVGFFRGIPSIVTPNPVAAPGKILTPMQDGKLKLVFLGALEEIKGIRGLVQTVAGMRDGRVTLDIYGEGSLRHEMGQLAAGVAHIRFFGSTKDFDVLGSYDALVFPSICNETQGLAMAEALVRGTPVIAANIGSIPETVVDGKNGYLFPAGDWAALRMLLADFVLHLHKISDAREGALQSGSRFTESSFRGALLAFFSIL